MQQNQTSDTTIDSTAQRLPYTAPILEELSSYATEGGKAYRGPENNNASIGS